jgi:manganese efflux pump family protein
MSADAFAAALGKGSTLDRPRLGEALRVGLVFGTVEAITPVIGWAGGLAASAYIAAIDHWIAFALLAGIGSKMVWDAIRRPGETAKPARHSLGLLLITAVGTSLDAMAVGVTLAFLGANIMVTAFAIGSATFVMTTIGIILGRVIGEKAWPNRRSARRHRPDSDRHQDSDRAYSIRLVDRRDRLRDHEGGHSLSVWVTRSDSISLARPFCLRTGRVGNSVRHGLG